uniref:Uncharacterized protein n=1 Tax=Rhizophora mucronata TaxID=61149 RepID=A0A2P2PZN9_RHIMU
MGWVRTIINGLDTFSIGFLSARMQNRSNPYTFKEEKENYAMKDCLCPNRKVFL